MKLMRKMSWIVTRSHMKTHQVISINTLNYRLIMNLKLNNKRSGRLRLRKKGAIRVKLLFMMIPNSRMRIIGRRVMVVKVTILALPNNKWKSIQIKQINITTLQSSLAATMSHHTHSIHPKPTSVKPVAKTTSKQLISIITLRLPIPTTWTQKTPKALH